MSRRHRRHEEHVNHEAWAIPYGDLLTLLLAFFVVMYAISSVNEGKYRVMSDSLYAAFRGAPRALEPVQTGPLHSGADAPLSGSPSPQAGHASLAPISAPAPPAAALSPEAAARHAAAAEALAHVADQVGDAMSDLIRRQQITVRRNDLWVEVEIRSDLLFPSGSAQLAPQAMEVIEQVAGVLAPLPNAVRVEGHTDNLPIRTAAFVSNWELSAARAGSVVRVFSGHGVDAARLAVVGLGDQHPLQSNDTVQGRTANRRVAIVILSTELTDRGTLADVRTPPALPAPDVAADADHGAVATPAPAAYATAEAAPAQAPVAAPLPAAAPPGDGTEHAN